MGLAKDRYEAIREAFTGGLVGRTMTCLLAVGPRVEDSQVRMKGLAHRAAKIVYAFDGFRRQNKVTTLDPGRGWPPQQADLS
jgi:hypothetical protein